MKITTSLVIPLNILEVIEGVDTQLFLTKNKDTVISLIDFLNNEKILVEPAMSCIIAALFQNKVEFKGKKIAIVVCGSNVTLEEVEIWKNELLG